MSDNQKTTFEIKDIIIDHNQPCKIFKITKIKPARIFFKLYPTPKNDNKLVSSIPIDNVDKAYIRKPLNKKEIKQLLKTLSQNIDLKSKSNANDTTKSKNKTKLLSCYNPLGNVELIRKLLIKKRAKNINYSVSDKNDFQTCIQNLAKEIAVVKNNSFEKEKTNLISIIKKIKIVKSPVSVK